MSADPFQNEPYQDEPRPSYAPRIANREYARRKALELGLDPDRFEKQLDTESGFSSRAFNRRTQAEGIGQYIPTTARMRPGFDPSDAKASIDAAAEDKRQFTDRFGNERAAESAHFNGPGKAIAALRNPTGNPLTAKYVGGIDRFVADRQRNPRIAQGEETSAPRPSHYVGRIGQGTPPPEEEERPDYTVEAPREFKPVPGLIDTTKYTEGQPLQPRQEFQIPRGGFAEPTPGPARIAQAAAPAAMAQKQAEAQDRARAEEDRRGYPPGAVEQVPELQQDYKAIANLRRMRPTTPQRPSMARPPAQAVTGGLPPTAPARITGRQPQAPTPGFEGTLQREAQAQPPELPEVRRQQQEGAAYLRSLPPDQRDAAAREQAKRYPLSDEERKLAGFGPLDWAAANIASPLAARAGRVIGGVSGLASIIESPMRAFQDNPPPNMGEQLGRYMQESARQGENMGGQGFLARTTREAADLAPLLFMPGGAVGFGAETALESYGADPNAGRAIKEGLIAAAPLFVLAHSPLGGKARDFVTEALSGGADAEARMAAVTSTQGRLMQYRALVARANDPALAAAAPHEAAAAAAQATAIRETLKTETQGMIDQAVSRLRRRLVAEVAGIGAEGATNAAQFVATSAALRFIVDGKQPTVDDLIHQSLVMLALEAVPAVRALGRIREPLSNLRKAAETARNVGFESLEPIIRQRPPEQLPGGGLPPAPEGPQPPPPPGTAGEALAQHYRQQREAYEAQRAKEETPPTLITRAQQAAQQEAEREKRRAEQPGYPQARADYEQQRAQEEQAELERPTLVKKGAPPVTTEGAPPTAPTAPQPAQATDEQIQAEALPLFDDRGELRQTLSLYHEGKIRPDRTNHALNALLAKYGEQRVHDALRPIADVSRFGGLTYKLREPGTPTAPTEPGPPGEPPPPPTEAQPPPGPPKQPPTDQEMQDLIDELSGAPPKKKKKARPNQGEAGMTLREFVRSRGGIWADDPIFRGEVARLGRKELGTTGLISNNRAKGLSADGMREAAVEARFFHPDDHEAHNVGDFIAAVERDMQHPGRELEEEEGPPPGWKAPTSDLGELEPGEEEGDTSFDFGENEPEAEAPKAERKEVQKFDVTLDDGRKVSVEYEPNRFGGDHFVFHGEATSSTGYRSHFEQAFEGDPKAKAKEIAEGLAVKQAKESAKEAKAQAKQEKRERNPEYIAKQIAEAEAEVKRLEAHRDDLQKRGDAALSDYDRQFGYDLEFNLRLNANQLEAAQGKLADWKVKEGELSATAKKPAPKEKLEKIAEPDWWKGLTVAGKERIIKAAGIKIPGRVLWQHISPENQHKLAAQEAEARAIEEEEKPKAPPEAEKGTGSNAELATAIDDLLNEFADEGSINGVEDRSFEDVVSEIEDLANDSDAPIAADLLDAVQTYRQEQVDDLDMGKRGDMEAADQAFLDAVQALIDKHKPGAKPPEKPTPPPAAAPTEKRPKGARTLETPQGLIDRTIADFSKHTLEPGKLADVKYEGDLINEKGEIESHILSGTFMPDEAGLPPWAERPPKARKVTVIASPITEPTQPGLLHTANVSEVVKNRTQKGWQFIPEHKQAPPEPKGGLFPEAAPAEPVTKAEIAQRVIEARERGRAAFKAGIKRASARDAEFMPLMKGLQVGQGMPILEAWTIGWDEANLAPEGEAPPDTFDPVAFIKQAVGSPQNLSPADMYPLMKVASGNSYELGLHIKDTRPDLEPALKAARRRITDQVAEKLDFKAMDAQTRARHKAHFDELNKDGPQDITLIACSSTKGETAAPAKDLYQGQLFKKSKDYAEATGNDYMILSAFHGLLDPNQKIEPYDRSLQKMSKAERDRWGGRLVSAAIWNIPKGSTITLLAGNDYAEPIEGALEAAGFKVNRPLKGLAIGEQQAKLTSMTSQAKMITETKQAPPEKKGASQADLDAMLEDLIGPEEKAPPEKVEPTEQQRIRWEGIKKGYQKALEGEQQFPGVPLKNIQQITYYRKEPGSGKRPSELEVVHQELVPRDQRIARENELDKQYPTSEFGSYLMPSIEPYEPQKAEPTYAEYKANPKIEPDWAAINAQAEAKVQKKVEKKAAADEAVNKGLLFPSTSVTGGEPIYAAVQAIHNRFESGDLDHSGLAVEMMHIANQNKKNNRSHYIRQVAHEYLDALSAHGELTDHPDAKALAAAGEKLESNVKRLAEKAPKPEPPKEGPEGESLFPLATKKTENERQQDVRDKSGELILTAKQTLVAMKENSGTLRDYNYKEGNAKALADDIRTNLDRFTGTLKGKGSAHRMELAARALDKATKEASDDLNGRIKRANRSGGWTTPAIEAHTELANEINNVLRRYREHFPQGGQITFEQLVEKVGKLAQASKTPIAPELQSLAEAEQRRSGTGREYKYPTKAQTTEFVEKVEAALKRAPGTRSKGTEEEKAGRISPEQVHEVATSFAEMFGMGESFDTITAARDHAEQVIEQQVRPGTPLAKQVDEAIELGVVMRAREILEEVQAPEESYQQLVELYDQQPTLSTRTSESVIDQAYSTPAPIAYVASHLALPAYEGRAYDPAAGNGMLLIDIDPNQITANELNPARVAALKATLPGATITQGDATTAKPPADISIVLTNPPFGHVKDENGQIKRYDINDQNDQRLYTTGEIDHAIAWNALKAMPDDGRAVLIVASVNPYRTGDWTNREARAQAYNGLAQRGFYYELYKAYNVTDHFTIDGDLYKKQGAGWPVDMIVIDGRGKSELALPAADVPRIYHSFDELGEVLNGTRAEEIARMGAKGEQPTRGAGGPRGASAEEGGLLGPPGLPAPRPDREGRRPKGRRPGRGGGTSTTGTRGPHPGPGERGGGLFGKPEREAPPPVRRPSEEPRKPGGPRGEGAPKPTATELARPSAPGGRVRTPEIDDLIAQLKAASKPPTEVKEQRARYGVAEPRSEFGERVALMLKLLKYYIEQGTKDFRSAAARFVYDYGEGARELDPLVESAWTKLAKFYDIDKPTTVTEALRPRPTDTQEPYIPESARGIEIGSLTPREMSDATKAALKWLKARVGNIDDYVASEIGEFTPKQFSAEQVDAIALALYNMSHGSGFIIGDQTGLGKGRVVGAVIKWALKNGKIPIFTTASPTLYADIYRDLKAIGVTDIRPLATNSDFQLWLDPNKTVQIKNPAGHSRTLQQMIANDSIGKYNMIFTTYSQMQPLGEGKPLPRREFLSHFGRDAVMMFDESHMAGGTEGGGQLPPGQAVGRAAYVRSLVQGAGAVLYSSATYAKRASVMDLYAATDIHLAAPRPGQLVEAMTRGGIPLQQVVAAMLVKGRQMIRRERSWDGIDYKTRPAKVDRVAGEAVSASMRSIGDFDVFAKIAVEAIKARLRAGGRTARARDIGQVKTTKFTSVVHNLIDQMLLQLKMDATVEAAVESIKRGEKPVVVVSNTMGAFIEEYVDDHDLLPGDGIDLDFGDMLHRYLEKSRTYMIKDPHGVKTYHYLTDEDLGPLGVRAYKAAQKMIDRGDWSGMPVSPIDYYKNEMAKRGYKIGEITGRQHTIDYSNADLTPREKREAEPEPTPPSHELIDGPKLMQWFATHPEHEIETPDVWADRAILRLESKAQANEPIDLTIQAIRLVAGDKFATAAEKYYNEVKAHRARRRGKEATGAVYARRPSKEITPQGKNDTLKKFNDGDYVGLLINQSGSTGISAHASREFKDLNPRHMIITQAEKNIDTFMQILGRINRTGQIELPSYVQLVADIAAEKRPAAVLSNKMASVNANTTGAVGGKMRAEDVVDFINQYGDEVVAEILTDNPDIHAKLFYPLDPNPSGQGLDRTDAATKATGRIALMTYPEQEALYAQIESEYKDYIAQLDAMGENALEAKTLELDARPISSVPIFQGPGGESPFAKDAIAELMDVKRLGKPYTSEEVLTQLRMTLKAPESDTLAALRHKGRMAAAEQLRDMSDRFNAYRAEALDDIENPGTRASMQTRLDTVHRKLSGLLRNLPVGQHVRLETPTSVDPFYGIVTKVEQKGHPKNPAALSSWKFTIAVADSARQFKINGNRLDAQRAADNTTVTTYQPTDRVHSLFYNGPILEFFDHSQTQSREQRTIVTGNLLGGYAAIPRGQIINFIDHEGKMQQGIMMPRGFNAAVAMDELPVMFANPAHIVQFVQAHNAMVTSADTSLRVVENANHEIRISAPAARARGGEYYTNPAVLAIVGTPGFVKSGQRMQIDLDPRTAQRVIQAYLDSGVALQTTTYKDEARQITGEQPPGGVREETAPYGAKRQIKEAGTPYGKPKSLTSAEQRQVRQKLEKLKAQAEAAGQKLAVAADEYLRQKELFEPELNDGQKAMLARLTGADKLARPSAEPEAQAEAKLTTKGGQLSLFDRIRKYGKGQLELFSIRPDADKQLSLQLGSDALADTERAAMSARSQRATTHLPTPRPLRGTEGAGIKTLGVGISEHLIQKGWVDLRGQVVRTAADVARVAQIFRDPRYETFRVIYTKGNRIVAHEGVSSRMPAASLSFLHGNEARDLEKMRQRMERLGADGYYLLHNHPSGKSGPSTQDVSLTNYYQHGSKAGGYESRHGTRPITGVPGFKGHVIIDSGEYSVIYPSNPGEKFGTVEDFKFDLPTDELLQAAIPHDLLNKNFSQGGFEEVAKLGKQLQAPEGFVVVIHATVKNDVRAIQLVPRALVVAAPKAQGTHLPKGQKIPVRWPIADFLRGQARAFGAGTTILYADSRGKPDGELAKVAGRLMAAGHIFDYVVSKGPEAFSALAQPGMYSGVIPTPRPHRVAEQREVPYGTAEAESKPGEAFYSQLQRSLTGLKQEKMTPDQLKSMLTKAGVKPDEMKWSGVEDLIERRRQEGKPVARTEAMDLARENAVDIQDVVKGKEPYEMAHEIERRAKVNYDQEVEERYNEFADRNPDQAAPYYGTAEEAEDKDGGFVARLHYSGSRETEDLDTYDDEDEALEAAEKEADKRNNSVERDIRNDIGHDLDYDEFIRKAREYTLEETEVKFGPEEYPNLSTQGVYSEYRELFVTAPATPQALEGERRYRAEGEQDRAERREALMRNDNLGFDTPSEAITAIFNHPDFATRWDIKPEDVEILRRFRAPKDYAAAQGRLQDANNAIGDYLRTHVGAVPARDRGLAELTAKRDLLATEAIAAADTVGVKRFIEGKRSEIAPRWKDGHDAYKDVKNPIVRLRFNARTDTDGKRVMHVEEMQPPSKAEQEKMPDWARKRWREIGMKRAIRYAAENDFDRITWTTGAMQVERYNLEKHVDKIMSFRRGDGLIDLMVFPKGHETAQVGMRYKDITGIKPAKLEEYVGKDLASKILEQPLPGEGKPQSAGAAIGELRGPRGWEMAEGRGAGKWETYEGLDLKVGGTGLTKIYDQDLVNAANGIAKPFGGKVGKTRLATAQPRYYVDTIKEGVYNVNDEDGKLAAGPFYDRWDAVAWIDGHELERKREAVHSLDITDSMKNSAMTKGHAIFEPRAPYGAEHHSHFQSRTDTGQFDGPPEVREPIRGYGAETPEPSDFEERIRKIFEAAENGEEPEPQAAPTGPPKGPPPPPPRATAAPAPGEGGEEGGPSEQARRNDAYIRALLEAMKGQRGPTKGKNEPPIVATFKAQIGVLYQEAIGQKLEGDAITEFVRRGLTNMVREGPEFAEATNKSKREAYKRLLSSADVERWVKWFGKQADRQQVAEAVMKDRQRVKDETALRLIEKSGLDRDLTKRIVEKAEKFRSAAERKISKDNQGAMLSGFLSRVSVMARSYGKAGGELVNKLTDGDIERSHIIDIGSQWVNAINEIYSKVKNPFEKQALNEAVVKALENRDVAEKYLKTDAQKEVYKQAVTMLDYFKDQLSKKGYKVLEDYFMHVRDVDLLDQLFGDVKDPRQEEARSLQQFISEKSPHLKHREGWDIRIKKDVPALLWRYLKSVSKELAYKDAVEYYYTRFQHDIPEALRENGLERAMQTMRNSLAPERVTGRAFKYASFLRTQAYRAFLGYNLKAALQNYTQLEFAKMRWLPEANRIRRQLRDTKKIVQGPLKDAVGMAARQTPRFLEMFKQEVPEKREGPVERVFNKLDPFRGAETHNWRQTELGSIINSVIKRPEWKATLKKHKGDYLKALDDRLQHKDIFDAAVREAAVTAAHTQVASNPAMRGERYDTAGARLLFMFTAFKARQLQVLGQALGKQEGINGARSQAILQRGLTGDATPVEVLRDVTRTRIAVDEMLKQAIKHKENLGVPHGAVKQYADYLRAQEGELNKIIQQIEPMGGTGARRAALVGRYFAATFAIALVSKLFWNWLTDKLEPPKTDVAWWKRFKKDTMNAAIDTLPSPIYGFNPADATASPLLPEVNFMPYGQFSPREAAKGLTEWGMRAVPYAGVINRASGQRISKGIVNMMVPPKTGGSSGPYGQQRIGGGYGAQGYGKQ